jgi:Polysaccharide deacetylase
MQQQSGIFTISLDFELYWGVRDKKNLVDYGEHLLGVNSAIPAILNLFDEYGIHATWASVGFLFFENFDEMIEGLPNKQPSYINKQLSPYEYIIKELSSRKMEVGQYHYAPSLIKLILDHQNQEIGSHTFSHYYCLEKGGDIDTFRADLEAACKIAEKYNIRLKSLVFPRNQTQIEYLSVLNETGILSYRGNENYWIYSPKNDEDGSSSIRRGLRLIDTYLKLSGSNCYQLNEIGDKPPFNICSSRFLRPCSKKLRFLEPLRLQRILSSMSYAAKKGLIYHLWWHPHNFGVDLDQNILFLNKILEHFRYLQESYRMESLNMGEIAENLINYKSAVPNENIVFMSGIRKA